MPFNIMLMDVTPLWASFMFHFFLSCQETRSPASQIAPHPHAREKQSREKVRLAPDRRAGGGGGGLANQPLLPSSSARVTPTRRPARLEKEA